MSVFAGPPLWGSLRSTYIPNIFPLPIRVEDVLIDGVAIGVDFPDGVFERPVLLPLNSTLEFVIANADLGRPYFMGKPGPFRNMPPNAHVFLRASAVFLYCGRRSRVSGFYQLYAPTGHEALAVSPQRHLYDFSRGKTHVILNPSTFATGDSITIFGFSIWPGLTIVTPL